MIPRASVSLQALADFWATSVLVMKMGSLETLVGFWTTVDLNGFEGIVLTILTVGMLLGDFGGDSNNTRFEWSVQKWFRSIIGILLGAVSAIGSAGQIAGV